MSIRIAIMVEGETEKVFLPSLRGFLMPHLQGRMPRLVPHVCDGRIPKNDDLRRTVAHLLKNRADEVIAKTDVYTGTQDFSDACDAKAKMKQWTGNEQHFHPHVALHDFEAWLIPYWSRIQKVAGSNLRSPGENPETINHGNPPAYRLAEIFRTGSNKRKYVKTRDALAILRDADLNVAASKCAELKALLNTILRLSGANALE